MSDIGRQSPDVEHISTSIQVLDAMIIGISDIQAAIRGKRQIAWPAEETGLGAWPTPNLIGSQDDLFAFVRVSQDLFRHSRRAVIP